MTALLREQVRSITADVVVWRAEEGVAAPRFPGTLAEERERLTALPDEWAAAHQEAA
jgi:hypothetical protein